MEEKYLEMARDFLSDRKTSMDLDTYIGELNRVATRFKEAYEGEQPADPAAMQLACNPAEAIGESSITCCICGKRFATLTRRHVEKHGLTIDEYRKICGYKKTLALSCKRLARARRKKMQEMRLWERTGSVTRKETEPVVEGPAIVG